MASKSSHAQAAQVAKINRSIVVFLLLGVAMLGALYQFVYSKQVEARSAAQTELDSVQSLVAKEQQDLEAVRSGSSESLRALYDRVAALDRTVPSSVDDLELAVWLVNSLPAGLESGLQISQVGEPQEVENVPGMRRYALPVTAQGPRASLLSWIQVLQTTEDRLITIEQITLSTDADGQASLTMTLSIWEAAVAPLVPDTGGVPVPPADGTDPAAPPAPDDPGAPGGDPNAPDDPAAPPADDPAAPPADDPAAPPADDPLAPEEPETPPDEQPAP